ncbi:type 1 glutamine amidotransferase domain-containing protein [Nocardia amamiensis]|uniref:Type 1 glutamine amidotransferase domain-containing protein n=1 Tax=Nocardia amamiensis TaxID=404578 RepID=A0ABS0CPW2_9NOCA|nr:type 1 glutamine amidotransferase domain-containing protein [Nocardia amamiensis]MBF6298662.1 type 1 glutamine amidotransferase domain-containing protein [Nocardia amamiensis]
MKQKKILAVVTNQPTYGESEHRTGLWLGELVHFYDKAVKAGYTVDVVSPAGGEVPLDPRSLGRLFADKTVRSYLDDPAFMNALKTTVSIADVDPDDYSTIFLTGGHGTMWDFPDNADLQRTAQAIYAGGGIVSSVCHGACALINLRDADGNPLVQNRTVTGFATVEERLAGVKSRVPFLLEDELRAKGANYVRSTIPMTPHAVRDGRLITGQNPVSTKVVSDSILAALAESE